MDRQRRGRQGDECDGDVCADAGADVRRNSDGQHDATSGANTLIASGTGIPTPTRIIGVSGNLAFGSVVTGQTARATMTITNRGNSALTVTRHRVSGGV